MLLLNNCSDAVASMVLRELMLSMRHRCLCGAISGAAWVGGAITLSMASAVISIPMQTVICFTFAVIRRGNGLRRNASSHSASSGLTAMMKAPCTLIIYRHRQRPRQSARSWAFGSVEGHLEKLDSVWPIVTPPIFRGFSAAHSFFRLARSKVAIAHFARI